MDQPIPADDLRVHQAALLLADRVDPSQIASRLDVDRSTVSRWLGKARSAGLLCETIAYGGTPEQSAAVRESLVALELTEKLREFAARNQHLNGGRTAKSVHVVIQGGPVENNEDFDQRAIDFGSACAGQTSRFVESARCIGIAWGRQMRAVLDGVLRRIGRTRCESPRTVVFPLWGEAWGPETDEPDSAAFRHRSQLSSSVLAAELSRTLNRRQSSARQFSLENVPLALPVPGKEYSAQQVKVLENYFIRTSQWKEIFGRQGLDDPASGDSSALVNRAELLLVPIGSKETPGRFLNREYLRHVLGEAQSIRLLNLVCGDIGGVLLGPYPTNRKPSDVKFLGSLKAKWTGVREDDLARCVSRTAATGHPGVAAYGVGKQRARPALEAIRLGLISHLLIDSMLANELSKLIDAENQQ